MSKAESIYRVQPSFQEDRPVIDFELPANTSVDWEMISDVIQGGRESNTESEKGTFTLFNVINVNVPFSDPKIIVGEPKYTRGGQLRGTTLDSTSAGFVEIKGGSSVLDSSYQLRLQTYRSLVEVQPYTIQTARPVNPAFRAYLERWGVSLEPIN